MAELTQGEHLHTPPVRHTGASPARRILLTLTLIGGLALGWLPAARSGDSAPDIFADGLSEQLLDRGRDALAAGQHETAERHLLEALQIIKINHGLRSVRQIEPLALIMQAQIIQGDWRALDSHADYFRWLNSRNLRSDFSAYLAGMTRLDELLLLASTREDNPQAARYLVLARNLNWQAVNAIEATLGDDSPVLLPWFYRIALKHYYQSTLIRRRGLTSYAFKSDADSLVSGWSMPKQEMLQMSYRVGEELLARMVDLAVGQAASSDSSAPDRARRLGALRSLQADWQLLFGYHEKAWAGYRAAYRAMEDAGLPASEVDGFFHRPRLLPLPETRALGETTIEPAADEVLAFTPLSPLYPGAPAPPSPAFQGVAATSVARLHFDLVPEFDAAENASGRLLLKNLRLCQGPATLPDGALPQEVALLTFRPRLLAGRPVAASGLELLYGESAQSQVLPPSPHDQKGDERSQAACQ